LGIAELEERKVWTLGSGNSLKLDTPPGGSAKEKNEIKEEWKE